MALTDEILVKESVRENSARVVWTLAWPAVALNSLQVVNTLLDRWFTGSLTSSALTGYGGSIVITFLMFSLAMSVATGATALVSRAFGAGEPAQWKMSAQQSMSITVFIGVVIALLQASLAGWVASLMLPATDQRAIQEMKGYVLNYALGLPAIFVIQTLAGSLRGTGDTKSPMYISGLQIILHICLNLLFIFPARSINGIHVPGLGLGLKGASLALSTSAWISALGYLAYLPKTNVGSVSLFRLPKWDWSVRILRIAMPAGLMSTLRVLSLAVFTVILKQLVGGSSAIAAMSIAFAIESIMFMPAFGLSVASAALVGQSLGMKRPERAERLAWTAAHHGALVTVCLAAPIFAFAPSIAMNITHDKLEIAQDAALLIRMLCLTEFLFAYAMVMIGAMSGAGDTVRPMWITLICLWGLRVPLAAVMALPLHFKLANLVPLPIAFGLGVTGAWLAMSGTQGLQGILAIAAFRQGHWKTEKV